MGCGRLWQQCLDTGHPAEPLRMCRPPETPTQWIPHALYGLLVPDKLGGRGGVVLSPATEKNEAHDGEE